VTRLADAAEVDERMIAQMVGYYDHAPLPPAFACCDRRVVRRALRLADGNVHRCVVEDDGAITVTNAPCWHEQRTDHGQ
jgi:hypothetical protein